MFISNYEKLLLKSYDLLVGIDEAGRGPWAGPVAIAGFIITQNIKVIEDIDDSKKLSAQKRLLVFKKLKPYKNNYTVILKSNKTIDKLGIGKTIEFAIEEIIKSISNQFKTKRIKFLIDGYFKKNFEADFELIKKGDSKMYSIASASIIAKVTRDLEMAKLAKTYPNYKFEQHVGYGTKLHRELLEKFGPCPIHRKSYKPISKLIRN